MIPRLKDACDHVVEENNALTNELADIISSCSGLIDGTDSDLEALRAASRKINRVANYRDSFQIYERGIRALEFDMVLRLSSMSGNSRSLQRESGISDTELKTGVDDLAGIYNSYMSEREAEELTDRLKKNNDIEAMLLVAEEIFAKDTGEWTDADARFIALTWDYGLKNRNVAIIESYTREMFNEEYTEPELSSFLYKETDETASWVSEYRIKADTQRIRLVMNKLDPETQGEAYYTLNRFSYLATDSIDTKGYGRSECKTGSYDVNVSVTGDVAQIEISSRVQQNRWWLPESTGVSITVCDMNKIINKKVEKALINFGFMADDIELARLSIISDTDVDFAKKFYSQNYKSAFKVNPEGMSISMMERIAEFMVKIEDMEYEAEQPHIGTGELEKIINVLLYADEQYFPALSSYYHEEYLDIITTELKRLSERDVATIVLGAEVGYTDEELKKLVLEGSEYYNQYSLWEAVSQAYSLNLDCGDIDLWNPNHAYGYMHMQISDLNGGIGANNGKCDGGCYSFNISVLNSDGKDALEGEYIRISNNYPKPKDVMNDQIEKKIEELEKEQSMLALNSVWDISGSAIDKIIPGGSMAISVLQALCEKDGQDLFDDIADFPYDEYCEKYEELTGKGLTTDSAKAIIDGIFRYNEIRTEIEENRKKYEINNFGKYTCIDVDYVGDGDVEGDEVAHQYIGCQILSPQAAYNIHRLEEEGIGAYLEDVVGELDDSEVSRKDFIEVLKIRYIENGYETNDGWTAFVNGDEESMFLIDPVGVIRKADAINKEIEGNYKSLSEWLNP